MPARQLQPRVTALRTVLRRRELQRAIGESEARKRKREAAARREADPFGGYGSEELQLEWSVLDYPDTLARMAKARRIPDREWVRGPRTERARQMVRDAINAGPPDPPLGRRPARVLSGQSPRDDD
jgi:hypothetical protein